MKDKKVTYRVNNYYSIKQRVHVGAFIHPDLAEIIMELARDERKTPSWVMETALADYFGYHIKLKKCKNPRPEFSQISKRKRA